MFPSGLICFSALSAYSEYLTALASLQKSLTQPLDQPGSALPRSGRLGRKCEDNKRRPGSVVIAIRGESVPSPCDLRKRCTQAGLSKGSGLLSLKLHPHPVERRLDMRRQLGAQLRKVEIAVHVGEDRALWLDALDPLERQFEMEMARVRPVP